MQHGILLRFKNESNPTEKWLQYHSQTYDSFLLVFICDSFRWIKFYMKVLEKSSKVASNGMLIFAKLLMFQKH
jgi:hypothetical protein